MYWRIHPKQRYITDVPLEWIYFFSFQKYDWVVNFPLRFINGWGFLRCDISVSYISTHSFSFFIFKTNS